MIIPHKWNLPRFSGFFFILDVFSYDQKVRYGWIFLQTSTTVSDLNLQWFCSHGDDCFHYESSLVGTSLSLYALLFNNIFAFSTAFMPINTFYMFQNNSFQVIEYLINLVWQLIQYDWLGLLLISHETMRQLIEGSLRSQMGKTTSCSPPIVNEEAMWGLMIEFLKGIKCNKMITFNQIHHTSSLGRIGGQWDLLGI